jgi:hypothetical protein
VRSRIAYAAWGSLLCSAGGAFAWACTGSDPSFVAQADAGDVEPADAVADGAGEPQPDAVDRDADAADAAELPNIVFVTSATYNGKLGGLAGADAICNALAKDAGLGAGFVAWLSTASVNASSRLGAARGWVRTDGKPFADTVADLTAGKTLYPLTRDELGAETPNAMVWTGTGGNGTATTDRCSDWTDDGSAVGATQLGRYGTTRGGKSVWTNDSTARCDTELPLYCFQTSRSSVVVVPPPTGRVAFLSESDFDPSTGLAAADAMCAAEGAAAGLGGTFKALLATSTVSPASRFDTSGPAWFRPDGVQLTAVAAFLSIDKLSAPIALHADGSVSAGDVTALAFTGSTSAAKVGSATCSDWSSSASSAQATVGYASLFDATYISGQLEPCSVPAGVYCFEE